MAPQAEANGKPREAVVAFAAGESRVSPPTQSSDDGLERCILSCVVTEDTKGVNWKGLVNGVPATFFLSTGSTRSFITSDLAERAGLPVVFSTPKLCEMVGVAQPYRTKGRVEAAIRIQDTYADTFQFEVLKELKLFDVILGNDWVKKIGTLSLMGGPYRASFSHENRPITLIFDS